MGDKDFLTAEQAKGLVEDIVGHTVKEVEEKITSDRASLMKDMLYAVKHTPKPQIRTKAEVAQDFAHLLGAYSAGKMNPDEALKVAKSINASDTVLRALGTTTVAGGGAIIEPEFAQEVIELLRADAVVLASGARTVPMASGVLNMGRIGTGATAAYRGESAAASASDPALEEIELRAKLLTVLTPASNQLLSRTQGRGAQMIQEELIAAASDKMDATFIRSLGTAYEPKGMLYQAATANKFDETNATGTTGASTTAEIVKDLGKAVRLLMQANVKFVRPGWLFAPRTWQRLFTELDSNGNFVFRSELETNMLYGVPWKQTTNVPITITAAAGSGAGSDASEVYLADFFECLVGETEALNVSMSTDASYTVSSSLVSAFERGETLIKVDMEHDFAVRHPEAIVVIESVTWGTV